MLRADKGLDRLLARDCRTRDLPLGHLLPANYTAGIVSARGGFIVTGIFTNM